MPSPFPGMDPWLENPGRFPSLHSYLVIYSAEQLQPQLVDRGYFVSPNERVWIEESRRDILPDGAVLQWKPETSAKGPVSVADADKPVKVRRFKSEFRQPYLEIFDKEGNKLITGIEFVSPT